MLFPMYIVLPVLCPQSPPPAGPEQHKQRKHNYSKVSKGQHELRRDLAHLDGRVVIVDARRPWEPVESEIQQSSHDVPDTYHAAPEGGGDGHEEAGRTAQ